MTDGSRAPDRFIEPIHLPGQVPYQDALNLQLERRSAIQSGSAGNALFTLEHAPVITCGKQANKEHLLHSPEAYTKAGIEVLATDRGGDVTYHGPGQLTAYPVFDLNHWKLSVNWYLRQLEAVIITTLGHHGIDADRLQGYTGVWTSQGKIAQIGIGVHRWVTFHGLAINVDPDMRHFAMIVPCGITDKPVTTMRAVLGTPLDMNTVRQRLTDTLLHHFESE